ncbi:MAG: hypothetical protein RR330_07060 [Alistipes sp.]
MGVAYKIRCKHCGAEFDHYVQDDYGVLPRCVGCGDYVEADVPIRCPGCRHKLNTTTKEFNEQVETVMMWN